MRTVTAVTALMAPHAKLLFSGARLTQRVAVLIAFGFVPLDGLHAQSDSLAPTPSTLQVPVEVQVPVQVSTPVPVPAVQAPVRNWTIKPIVTVSAIQSSNMALESSPQAGLITSVAPGISIDGVGGRVSAHLNASVNDTSYEGHPQWTNRQNWLSSFATVSAIDKWLYLDGSFNISNRSQTPFAPITTDLPVATQSQVETRTTLFSPYIKGNIENRAQYLVRLNFINSGANDPAYANTQVNQALGTFKGLNGGDLDWFSDFDSTVVNNTAIGSKDDRRVRIGLDYALQPRLHTSISTGYESTNYATPDRDQLYTPGLGLDWKPSEHAQASVLWEQRFFGVAQSIKIKRVSSLSAWSYSESRDVAVFPSVLVGYNPGAISSLMSDMLAASIPDPSTRADTVRNQMNQLGSSSSFSGDAGSSASSLYVNHVREASVAMLGRRNTLTLTLQEIEQSMLPYSSSYSDLAALSSDLRQQNMGLTWLHLVTPTTNLVASLIRQINVGLTDPFPQSSQSTAGVSVNRKLGPLQSLSVGLHRTFYNSIYGAIDDTSLAFLFTQGF